MLLATLLAAALLGRWLLSERGERPAALSSDRPESDYYVTGARLLQTDQRGRPDYEVRAARMLHRQDEDSWLLESPTMTVFAEVGAPWYGRAEHGRIWASGDEAELLGAVRLWRERSVDNRPVTLDTRDVYLRPRQKYAETGAVVVVHQEQNRLTGTGARIYLDEERYQLLSNVEGSYVPTPN